MKQGEFVDEGRTRMTVVNRFIKASLIELGVKGIVTVCAERVRVAKPVGRDLISPVYQYGLAHGAL